MIRGVVTVLAGAMVALGVAADALAQQYGPADRGEKWQQHCEQQLAARLPGQIAGKVKDVRIDWNLAEAARKGATGHLKGEGLMNLNGHKAGFLFQCEADVHSAEVRDVHFRMK